MAVLILLFQMSSFQVGSLAGLCWMEELYLIMTHRKMPGKVAKAALKFQFVKFKVSVWLNLRLRKTLKVACRWRALKQISLFPALPQFIPQTLHVWIWPYQESSTFISGPSMQQKGRNGWWHWERPKPALLTTEQREKKVSVTQHLYMTKLLLRNFWCNAILPH